MERTGPYFLGTIPPLTLRRGETWLGQIRNLKNSILKIQYEKVLSGEPANGELTAVVEDQDLIKLVVGNDVKIGVHQFKVIDTTSGDEQLFAVTISPDELLTVRSLEHAFDTDLFTTVTIKGVNTDGINYTPKSFNTVDPQDPLKKCANEIEIQGVEIVIPNDKSNQMYKNLQCEELGLPAEIENYVSGSKPDPAAVLIWSSRKGLNKRVSIVADKVRIGAKLNLAGTDVLIYARIVEFEGVGAISTAPCYKNYQPAGMVGSHGLNAGSIEISAYEVIAEGAQTRLDLTGGQGQRAKNGENTDQEPALPYHNIEVNGKKIKATRLISADGALIPPWTDDEKHDGLDGIAGGLPGYGGSGGSLTCSPNLQSSLAPITVLAIGKMGQVAETAHGSEPREPNPGIWVQLDAANHLNIVKQLSGKKGKDFAGQQVVVPTPQDGGPTEGKIGFLDSHTGWMNTDLIDLITTYINDLFLGNSRKRILDLCVSYLQIFKDWNGVSLTEEQLQFKNFIADSYNKAVSGIDAFNHPEGWYPSRDFISEFDNYKAIIEIAKTVIALERYRKITEEEIAVNELNTRLQDAQKGVIASLLGELEACEKQSRELEQRLKDNLSDTNELVKELSIREKNLLQDAITNVDTRNDQPGWLPALKALTAIAKVSPIGQPYAIVAGVTVDVMLDMAYSKDSVDDIALRSFTSIGELAASGALSSQGTSTDEYIGNWETSFDALTDSGASAEARAKAISFIKGEGARAKDIYSKVKQHFKENGISNDEIQDELTRLRKNDRYLHKLFEKTKQITDEKAALSASVIANEQRRTTIMSGITTTSLQINTLAEAQRAGELLRWQNKSITKIFLKQRSVLLKELLRLQYWLIKAFEYRFCESYSGDYIVGVEMERLLNLASSKNSPDAEILLKEALWKPAAGILTLLKEKVENGSSNATWLPKKQELALSAQECDALSKGTLGKAEVILPSRLRFLLGESNRRIKQISIDEIDIATSDSEIFFQFYVSQSVFVLLNGAMYKFVKSTSYLDKILIDSGKLKIVQPPQGLKPNYERSEQKSVLDALTNLLAERVGSSQIDLGKLGQIGLETTLQIFAEGSPGVARSIKSMKLMIEYDTVVSDSSERILMISEGEDLEQPIEISIGDRLSRKSGYSPLVRVYKDGEVLEVTAPATYQSEVFSEWVFSTNFLKKSASNPLQIQMDENVQLQPVYKSKNGGN